MGTAGAGDDDGMRAQIAALTAQVAAMAAAMQSMAAASAKVGTFGDGTLLELLELHAKTWPRDATWKGSRRSTLTPAATYFGDRPARSLTKGDWLYWRDSVRAETTTLMKDKPEPVTLNYEITCWRRVYRLAVEDGLLVSNPLAELRPLPAKKHRQTEPTIDDVYKMRPHLDAEGWAYALLYQRRGLRASESRRLEWVNVDLDRGRLKFMAAKTRVWTTVRIPSDIVEALRAIRPDIPPRFVFESPRKPGQPVHATHLWGKWRAAADLAGLGAAPGDRRRRPHDSRHGFTSDQARKNPIAVAMKMSRHAGYRSAQRYIHCNEDDLATAYDRLEDDARHAPQKSGPPPTERVGRGRVTGE